MWRETEGPRWRLYDTMVDETPAGFTGEPESEVRARRNLVNYNKRITGELVQSGGGGGIAARRQITMFAIDKLE